MGWKNRAQITIVMWASFSAQAGFCQMPASSPQAKSTTESSPRHLAQAETAQIDAPYRYLSAKGVEAYKKGRLAESERLLKSALADAQNENLDSARLALIQTDLAGVLRDEQKYGEAQPLFKRALELEKKDVQANKLALNFTAGQYMALLNRTDQKTAAFLLEQDQKNSFRSFKEPLAGSVRMMVAKEDITFADFHPLPEPEPYAYREPERQPYNSPPAYPYPFWIDNNGNQREQARIEELEHAIGRASENGSPQIEDAPYEQPEASEGDFSGNANYGPGQWYHRRYGHRQYAAMAFNRFPRHCFAGGRMMMRR